MHAEEGKLAVQFRGEGGDDDGDSQKSCMTIRARMSADGEEDEEGVAYANEDAAGI